MEIEWNNKDPFFDRDLENFKRLHADGAISLGIIITRGAQLQGAMKELVGRFADEKNVSSFDDLARLEVEPTPKQRKAIGTRTSRKKNPIRFRQAWVENFVSNKFGAATTHWSKLDDRIVRGVGNPCPLVLIGLSKNIVTFGEDPAAVKQLLQQAERDAETEEE